MAAVPAATSTNCKLSSNRVSPPGKPPTTPLDAAMAYEVIDKLAPSNKGPRVTAAQ